MNTFIKLIVLFLMLAVSMSVFTLLTSFVFSDGKGIPMVVFAFVLHSIFFMLLVNNLRRKRYEKGKDAASA